MDTPRDEAERVRLWIALGQQPGVSAWFGVWRLAQLVKPRTAERRRSKGLGRERCTA